MKAHDSGVLLSPLTPSGHIRSKRTLIKSRKPSKSKAKARMTENEGRCRNDGLGTVETRLIKGLSASELALGNRRHFCRGGRMDGAKAHSRAFPFPS